MEFKKILFVLFALYLSLVSCKIQKQNSLAIEYPEAGSIKYTTTTDITGDDIHWHISVLTSDSMQGRMAGTYYETLAAEYIKDNFKSLKLKYFGDSYFQTVPISSRSYFDKCELYFDGFSGNYPSDFRPVIMFDSLTISGEAIFLGYGNDTDYNNIDVKDKWVVIQESGILYDRKATAKLKGASGLLAIGKDGNAGNERYILPSDSMPLIRISRNFADSLLARAGASVSEVLSKIKADEILNIPIPVVVHATIRSVTQPVTSRNVVACLETGDPEDEDRYIVIGAHYDHIGTKKDGDTISIFYGADDNASGVAGMLEIAEKLRAEKKLKYNVIFAAFGAEEFGLIGSRYFCNHPPVPLEKIKLMINMDMIGRMDSANHVYVNTVEPNAEIDEVLNEIKNSHPDIDVVVKLDRLNNTDYAPFFDKNVPVISFTTGLHSEYHTPADTLDSINFKGGKLLLDFIYDFIMKEVCR